MKNAQETHKSRGHNHEHTHTHTHTHTHSHPSQKRVRKRFCHGDALVGIEVQHATRQIQRTIVGVRAQRRERHAIAVLLPTHECTGGLMLHEVQVVIARGAEDLTDQLEEAERTGTRVSDKFKKKTKNRRPSPHSNSHSHS